MAALRKCPVCREQIGELVVSRVGTKMEGMGHGWALTLECPKCGVVLGAHMEQATLDPSDLRDIEKIGKREVG